MTRVDAPVNGARVRHSLWRMSMKPKAEAISTHVNEAQQSLKDWGDEHWDTGDGEQAVQGEETHRYLPDAAWKELSPEEKKATDRKKVAASKRGVQFVANTPAAAKARKRATKHES